MRCDAPSLRSSARSSAVVFALSLSLIVLTQGASYSQEAKPGPERWESAIQEFEKADAEHPPVPGRVLFVGSSSIRLWDLAKSFPEYDTVNRGFGGSQVADSVHFFERIVAPHRPRIIVMYAGDNDIAGGKTPEQVHSDFRQFVAKVKGQLPGTPLVYIAIKPSIKRWNLIESVRKANTLIKGDCDKDPRLDFFDIDAPMLGADGQPRPELFVKDGLHLSEIGYELWSNRLRPFLDPLRADPRFQVRKLGDQYHPWSPPETLEAWDRERQRIREQLLVSCGLWPMPEKTPLKPVIHGRIEKDDYVIDKVSFESFPGMFVTGNVYRPKKVEGKIPGVLNPHGHWPNGRFYDAGEAGAKAQMDSGAEQYPSGARFPLQARMVQLAKLGCVVFHYDMIGYADSRKLPHRDGFNDADASLWLHNKLGLQTWNSIRALDFLESLPDVDPQRLAVTGASGGGTQTFMLCAIDPRPAAAFPAVMVSTNMQGGCTCENADYLRIGINNVAIAALFAPRPMAMTGADDWTVDIERKGLPELKHVYGFHNAADKVHAKYYSFPHNYNGVSRTMMLTWFREHLRLPGDAPVEQCDFQPVPVEELSVFDAAHPQPASELDAGALRRELKAHDRAVYEKLLAGDAGHYREIIGTATRVMLSRVDESAALQATKFIPARTAIPGRVEADAVYQGERAPVSMLTPANADGDVVLCVDPAGLLNGDLTGSVIRSGKTVAIVDPFVSGAKRELAQFLSPVDTGFPGYTWGYNRPLIANRVRDIQAAVQAIRGQGKRVVALIGTGEGGLWTLLARAQLPEDAVGRTIVDLQGFSFASVDSPNHPNALPGALKYGDVGGLAALAAPAHVEIYGAQGLDSALAPLKKLYSGTPDRLTIHSEGLTADAVRQALATE